MFAAFLCQFRIVEIRLGQAMEISMKTFTKLVAALVVGAGALGVTTAFADHDERRESRYESARPEYCAIDHDHRSHDANYYDYYPADKYYRAGPYRRTGMTLSVRIGDRGYRGGRHENYYNRYGYGGRYNRGRPVHREVYDTRFRARIVLTEEVNYSRRGPRLICTVSVRGPEARYVPYGRLRRIAVRECSPRARIRIDA